MEPLIAPIIVALFFAAVFSGQAQPHSNLEQADTISSQHTTVRDSIPQAAWKNQVSINGTNNLVAIETTAENDTSSVNNIAVNGTRNAVRIKQSRTGRMMIRQNGSGNHVSIIQNKEE